MILGTITSHMEKLLADLNLRYELNVPLGPLTWYGVGGPAAALAHPSSIQQLSSLLVRCREAGKEVYILGQGANLLVSDRGVDGVVVKLDDPNFSGMEKQNQKIVAGAGMDLARLVLQAAKAGLAGLECVAGIPASLGGAVRMNAGGAFGDIGRSVKRLQVMDASGQVYYRQRDDLMFGYRSTNIVAKCILQVEMDLTPDDPEELIKRVKEIFLYKKNSQPLADHSAGCAYKNPDAPGEDEMANLPRALLRVPVAREGRYSAGMLIDRAGLKGYRVGGAEVSPQHANFIVCYPGCTATNVLEVMTHVEQVVLDTFGIRLQREVVVWP
ncbi:MAG: UDP-N-acetylmuramate dehydrogenase [Phycisphaeraceae bacterium]|nr:UDP-N-acetylmuramate dehydrogenase [Phycisphaeraceae bacterium]